MISTKKHISSLLGILLGLLSLSTHAATATIGTPGTAPATNFLCNSYNGNLIDAYAGNAAPGMGGFFMSIPSNCTSSNVCVFVYTASYQSNQAGSPAAQNNNSKTTLTNGGNPPLSGKFLAFTDGSGSGQCIWKPGYPANTTGTLTLSSSAPQNTGQTESYWESQGYSFN